MRCTDGNSRRAWCQAFKLKGDDAVGLARAVADVFGLISETRRQLQSIPDIDHGLYMQSFPPIKRLLSLDNIGQTWNPIRSELQQPHILQGLRFCAAALKQSCAEPVLDSEALSSLLKAVSDAIESITIDDTIPSNLRALLLEHLQAIQSAIGSYRIYGASALKHAIERAIGGLIAHRQLVLGQESSDPIQRFCSVLDKGSQLLQKAGAFAKHGFFLASVAVNTAKLLNGVP